MMHLFLKRRPPAFLKGSAEGKVLHFASERGVRAIIDENPNLMTISADIEMGSFGWQPPPRVLVDIQELPLCAESIQGIFNLHVLEHIPDDRQAIAEMYRILRRGGEAVVMVPFMLDHLETCEYGAPDPFMWGHVRGYSPLDFKERLAPFSYEEVLPASFLSEEELTRFRIPRESQVIYVCRKD